MRIIETPVYYYDELTVDAQVKARETWRYQYSPLLEQDWCASILETIRDLGCAVGICIDPGSGVGGAVEFNLSDRVFRFSGGWEYRADWRDATEREFGDWRTQDTIISRFLRDYADFCARWEGNLVTDGGPVSCTVQPVYRNCVYVEMGGDEDAIATAFGEAVDSMIRRFCACAYQLLCEEFDYYDSDEYIIELLQNSEYEFTEGGQLV